MRKRKTNEIPVYAPMNGEIIPLSSVDDVAFSSEILGKGCAVIPSDGKVYSPVNGIIEAIPSSHHAIAIHSDSGCDILIHVGKDTVSLGGKYFSPCVSVDDEVSVGDLLLVFERSKLISEGYDIKTPILIQDPLAYRSVEPLCLGNIKAGDALFRLEKS